LIFGVSSTSDLWIELVVRLVGFLLYPLLVEVPLFQLELAAGNSTPVTLVVTSGAALGRAAVLEDHVIVLVVLVYLGDNACGWYIFDRLLCVGHFIRSFIEFVFLLNLVDGALHFLIFLASVGLIKL